MPTDYYPEEDGLVAEGAIFSYTAGEALEANRVVYLSGATTVMETDGEDTRVIGVTAVKVDSGEKVSVYSEGIVKVTAAGSITAGASVKSAASGRVQAWASGDNPHARIGRALQTCTAAGDEILIKLTL